MSSRWESQEPQWKDASLLSCFFASFFVKNRCPIVLRARKSIWCRKNRKSNTFGMCSFCQKSIFSEFLSSSRVTWGFPRRPGSISGRTFCVNWTVPVIKVIPGTVPGDSGVQNIASKIEFWWIFLVPPGRLMLPAASRVHFCLTFCDDWTVPAIKVIPGTVSRGPGVQNTVPKIDF